MENFKKNKVAFIPLFLSLCIIFLSIGYASMNSITGEIKGTLLATKQDGVFITDVIYDSSVNANQLDSNISNFYKTTLNSNIVLSNIDNDSAITYKVVIYNSTDDVYKFDGVLYDNDFYDNNNIIFKLTDLEIDDQIIGNGYITFYITFSYLNDLVVANNQLNSYLNFQFVKVEDTVDNNDLDLQYNLKQAWVNGEYYFYECIFTLTNIGNVDIENWVIDIPISSGYKHQSSWSDGGKVKFNFDNDKNINISSSDVLASGKSISFTMQIGVMDSAFDFDSIVVNNTKIKDDKDNQETTEDNNQSESNNENETIFTTNGIEYVFEFNNSWIPGDGTYYFQYNVSVTNTTDKAISNWQIVLDVPSGSKASGWSLNFENLENTIIIRPPDFNTMIEPGATFNQGGMQLMVPDPNYVITVK